MSPASLKEAESPGIADFLPAHQVEKLSEEQKKGLRKAIDPSGYLAMTPMICKDYACPIIDKCPLKRLQIARPVGEDCPVESSQVRTWRDNLFQVLPVEEQGDPYNVMMVNDIALLELIEQRAMAKMAAEGGDIEQEITVGHAPDGTPLLNKDVHRSLQVYEKISKIKQKLMSKLLQTPQDRAKAAAAGMYDRSQAAAKLMSRYKEIVKRDKLNPAEAAALAALEEDEPQVLDAQFEVKEDPPPSPPLPPEGV